MNRIEIPEQFHRNSPNVVALGVENTGATLLACGNELLGRSDLAGMDILDVDAGSASPKRSSTGICPSEPILESMSTRA